MCGSDRVRNRNRKGSRRAGVGAAGSAGIHISSALLHSSDLAWGGDLDFELDLSKSRRPVYHNRRISVGRYLGSDLGVIECSIGSI